MYAFFAEPQAFIEDLTTKPDTCRCCWACARSSGPLTWMNVARDLRSLGLPTPGCEAGVTLCPLCLAGYVDGLNVVLDAT
jgi:hypothetical protein